MITEEGFQRILGILALTWICLLTGLWAYFLPAPLSYPALLFGACLAIGFFFAEQAWIVVVATITSIVSMGFIALH